jgi:hypothetical protein
MNIHPSETGTDKRVATPLELSRARADLASWTAGKVIWRDIVPVVAFILVLVVTFWTRQDTSPQRWVVLTHASHHYLLHRTNSQAQNSDNGLN